MVLPVTGPFTKTVVDNHFVYKRQQSGFKQAKPIDRPLGYNAHGTSVLRQVGNEDSQHARNEADPAFLTWSSVNHAKIAAYDKFKSKLSDRASLGAAVAEISQSYGMIVSRAVQLAHFTAAIRKGHLGDAAKILRVPDSSRRQRPGNIKAVTGQWLEFSFGWAPLVGDIGSAINVLQQPVKDWTPIAASASSSASVFAPPPVSYTRYIASIEESTIARYGATVSVTNPNLWLANQLGFVNPAQVLWEVVPFSFVVDWFVNVEQILGSFTDFLGLTLRDSYSTTYSRRLKRYRWTSYSWAGDYSQFGINRLLGIVTPSLGFRPAKAWGLGRAANAVSVLVQQLKRLH